MKIYIEGEFWVVNIVKPSFAIDENLQSFEPITPKAHCCITDEKPFRSSVLLTSDILIHLDTIQEIYSYKFNLSDNCCIYVLRLKYKDNYCSISTDDCLTFKKFSESLMKYSEIDITIRTGNFWVNTLRKDNIDGLVNYDIDKLFKQRIDIFFSHLNSEICIKDFTRPEDFYSRLQDLSAVYTREIVVKEVGLYALCVFLPEKQYALITDDRARALDWCKVLRGKANLGVEISMHNFFWFPVGRSLNCQMGFYKGFDYTEEKEHFIIIKRLRDGRHFLMANNGYPTDDVIIPLDEVNNAYLDRITENKERKKNRTRRFVLCIQYRKWHYELLTLNERLGNEWSEKIKKISWLRPPANPKGQLKDYVDESIWFRTFQNDLELQDDFRKLKAADSVYEGILPKSSIVEPVEKVSSAAEAVTQGPIFTKFKSTVNNQVSSAEPITQGGTFTKFKSMVNSQISSTEFTPQASTFTKLKAMVNNQLNVPSLKDFLLGGKRQKKRHSLNDIKKHYEHITIQNGTIPTAENRTYFNQIDKSDNMLSARKRLSSSGSEASVSENPCDRVTKRSWKSNTLTVNGIRPRSKSDDNLIYTRDSSYDFYL